MTCHPLVFSLESFRLFCQIGLFFIWEEKQLKENDVLICLLIGPVEVVASRSL